MTRENGMPPEGEGSGKRYHDAQREFAKTSKGAAKARGAGDALNKPEVEELEEAGNSSARGEPNARKS